MPKPAQFLRSQIEKSVFVAKHTAQIGQYLQGTEAARLLAFTGPEPEYLNARCRVHSISALGSSKLLMSDPIALGDLLGEIQVGANFWLYEPYEWVENLRFLDVRTFANSYFLFRRYSNKINQLRYFLSHGNDILRQQMTAQLHDFTDHLVTSRFSSTSEKVVYDHPYSEGGKGIRNRTEIIRTASALNPVRVAQYCRYEMGVSQAGTVFSDVVICAQPARVWNGANGHPFSSSCTFYDLDLLEPGSLAAITEMTRSVGLVLQKLGYRGAFGCDYLFDPASGKIFVGEANLRYTGDIALFCSAIGEEATFQNLLHPHSLHILSFLGSSQEFGLAGYGVGYVRFEDQGGAENRAFFDPGAPIKKVDGSWAFTEEAWQAPAPPIEYRSLPVNLEF